MAPQVECWPLIERHFSRDRLAPYVVDSGGDHPRAIALYRWDADVRAAFLTPLGHLEIAVRNALDRQMSIRQRHIDRHRHWVFDDSHQLGRDANGSGRHLPPYVDIEAAIRHVRANHKPIEAAQVISELPLGFWHQLVSKRQTFLWPDLARGFPYAPSRSVAPIRDRFARLRALRNRIGHHHRVGGLDLLGRYGDILALAGYVDPDLREWIDSTAIVSRVLSRRP